MYDDIVGHGPDLGPCFFVLTGLIFPLVFRPIHLAVAPGIVVATFMYALMELVMWSEQC